jgi:hypothetical protein
MGREIVIPRTARNDKKRMCRQGMPIWPIGSKMPSQAVEKPCWRNGGSAEFFNSLLVQ